MFMRELFTMSFGKILMSKIHMLFDVNNLLENSLQLTLCSSTTHKLTIQKYVYSTMLYRGIYSLDITNLNQLNKLIYLSF